MNIEMWVSTILFEMESRSCRLLAVVPNEEASGALFEQLLPELRRGFSAFETRGKSVYRIGHSDPSIDIILPGGSVAGRRLDVIIAPVLSIMFEMNPERLKWWQATVCSRLTNHGKLIALGGYDPTVKFPVN